MSASFGAATLGSRPEPLSAAYRRLRQLGFDDPAAANLTALRSGVPIGSQPWKVRELAHLLFLRELANTRGEWNGTDDRATNVVEGWRIRRRMPRYLDESDGRITLLTLFQAAAGSAATLDHPAPRALRPPSASPETRREGGMSH